MSQAEAVKFTAGGMEQLLRAHFSAPAHAVITGVRNAAGFDASRTCDLLAIGIWKSTGCFVEGVEIKVSRGDWLREIQDPAKAEAFAQYCDYWWIAAPTNVVKLEELPASWGLMEPSGGGLRVRRPATRRETPAPISRAFLACIARRVVEQSPAEDVLKQAEQRGYERARVLYEKREEDRIARAGEHVRKDEYDRLRGTLEDFAKHAGVHLSTWNAEMEGKTFARFRAAEGGVEDVRGTLVRLQRVVAEALEKSAVVA